MLTIVTHFCATAFGWFVGWLLYRRIDMYDNCTYMTWSQGRHVCSLRGKINPDCRRCSEYQNGDE